MLEFIIILLPVFSIVFFIIRLSHLYERKRIWSGQNRYRRLSTEEFSALQTRYFVYEDAAVYTCEGKMTKNWKIPYLSTIYYRIKPITLTIQPEMEIWIKPDEINRVEFIFVGVKAIAIKINDVDISYLIKQVQNQADWQVGRKGSYSPSCNEMIKSRLKNQGASDSKIKQNTFLRDSHYHVTKTRTLTPYEKKTTQRTQKTLTKKVLCSLFASSIFLVLLQSGLLNSLFYLWAILTFGCLFMSLFYFIKSKMPLKLNTANKVTGTITSYNTDKQELVLNNELIIYYPKKWEKHILQDEGESITLEVNTESYQLVSYRDVFFLENEKIHKKDYKLPFFTIFAQSAVVILIFTVLNITPNNIIGYIKDVATELTTSDSNVITLDTPTQTIINSYQNNKIVKFRNVPAICIDISSYSENCSTILIIDEESLKNFIQNYPVQNIPAQYKNIMEIYALLIKNELIKYNQEDNKINNVDELDTYVKRVCINYYSSKESAECKKLNSIIRRIKFDNTLPNDSNEYISLMKYQVGNIISQIILPISSITYFPSALTTYVKNAFVIKMDGEGLLSGFSKYTHNKQEQHFEFYRHLTNPEATLTTPISFSGLITSLSREHRNNYFYEFKVSSKVLNKKNGEVERLTTIQNRAYFTLISLIFITIFSLYYIVQYGYIKYRDRRIPPQQ